MREVSADRYVFGLLGQTAIDVRDVCPSGAAERVQLVRGFGSYVASVASLGVYLPQNVRITCAQRRRP